MLLKKKREKVRLNNDDSYLTGWSEFFSGLQLDIDEIPGRRGGINLLMSGYRYTGSSKDRKNNRYTFECSSRKKYKCNARIERKVINGRFMYRVNRNPHKCPRPTNTQLAKHMKKKYVKKKYNTVSKSATRRVTRSRKKIIEEKNNAMFENALEDSYEEDEPLMEITGMRIDNFSPPPPPSYMNKPYPQYADEVRRMNNGPQYVQPSLRGVDCPPYPPYPHGMYTDYPEQITSMPPSVVVYQVPAVRLPQCSPLDRMTITENPAPKLEEGEKIRLPSIGSLFVEERKDPQLVFNYVQNPYSDEVYSYPTLSSTSVMSQKESQDCQIDEFHRIFNNESGSTGSNQRHPIPPPPRPPQQIPHTIPFQKSQSKNNMMMGKPLGPNALNDRINICNLVSQPMPPPELNIIRVHPHTIVESGSNFEVLINYKPNSIEQANAICPNNVILNLRDSNGTFLRLQNTENPKVYNIVHLNFYKSDNSVNPFWKSLVGVLGVHLPFNLNLNGLIDLQVVVPSLKIKAEKLKAFTISMNSSIVKMDM